MSHFIVIAIATCRRPAELVRLLDSLKKTGTQFGAIIVVDNGNDPATQNVFEASGLPGVCLPQLENAGCGGGLQIAEKTAVTWYGNAMTHLWILDDDAVVLPGAPELLLEAMQREDADVASAMVLNGDGTIGNYPGLLDPAKFRAIRDLKDPSEFIARCSPDPIPFSWSTGIALLVSRRALDELGVHRADYWVRGEDLEFSLRITHKYKGILVPTAQVQHIPPSSAGAVSQRDEYLKHSAMLQNLCYTSLRLPHGHRIARTLPGNFLRFYKTWPLARAILDSIRAFCIGALLGKPAGLPGADHFKRASERNHPSNTACASPSD